MNRYIFLILLSVSIQFSCFSQVKILFDASHAETSGNSGDWTIDADTWNLNFPSSGTPYTSANGYHSNPQQIPTLAQSGITAATPESYWTGCISNWGIDCVNKGYTVESLPYTGKITYGLTTNTQDLSNYKVFVVCEPNIAFTDAEKTAIINFVKNGGGLYMICDHVGADRNSDGWDSPRIWDNLIDTNTVQTNPFGIHFDQVQITGTYSVLGNLPASDTLLHGPMGNVTKVRWSAGNTMTISTAANPTVKGVIFKTGASNTGSTNVVCAYARYGAGKVVAMADSSPFDDGTGDTKNTNATYYKGYTGDTYVGDNHRTLIMNSTIWLASSDGITYTFTGNGNWNQASNWSNNLIPPTPLPAKSAIVINNSAGGECLLNIAQQHISTGASLTVLPGKKLVVPGELKIQ